MAEFSLKVPKASLLGFQMVIFSFIGVELIGLTAAEAKEPKKTITRAVDQLPIRIILFYVLAILSILLAIPWDKVSTSSSPFVQTLGATGIKNAGSIINFVVISAAISSTNSFIYSAGRLLFSINYKGKTKLSRHLGKLDRRQLPKNALIFSTILIALAPLLNFFLKDAFTFHFCYSDQHVFSHLVNHDHHPHDLPKEKLRKRTTNLQNAIISFI
jgi:AAT family amino acid transporter